MFYPPFRPILAAVISLAFSAPAAAQLNISYVDYELKESKTLEFDYYGSYDFLKKYSDVHGRSTLNNKLVLNRDIEHTSWGNWQKARFEIISYNNSGTKSQIKQVDVKVGGKRYIGTTRYFGFSVFEANQYRVTPGPQTTSDDIFEGDGIYSFALVGGGGGRVLDHANDLRARKVLDELLRRGILTVRLPEEQFNRMVDLLRKREESSKRVLSLQQFLRDAGVVAADAEFDQDAILALTKLIDGSADRLESGLEGRLGFGHELSKENSRQENLNLLGMRVRYSRPLSDRIEWANEINYLRGWAAAGSGNNMKSTFQVTYSTVKIDLSAAYRLDLDVRTYSIRGDDFSYSRYFNELAFITGYEIYNRINLTGTLKFNRTDYKNDFEIGSTKSGWNRELHFLVNYEIY